MKTINFRETTRSRVQRVFFVPIDLLTMDHGDVIVDYGTHKERVKIHDDDIMTVANAVCARQDHLKSIPVVGG